ncbi:MAG: hypothetical protein ACE5H1_09330 [Thermodesulfobacteriota bacterium]
MTDKAIEPQKKYRVLDYRIRNGAWDLSENLSDRFRDLNKPVWVIPALKI